jgi:IS1 family transposase
MNKLSPDKQKIVLSLLIEGNSIRSIQRITGVDQNTVMSLLVRAGTNARTVLDREIKDVPCKFLEIDEIWCFVGTKQAHLRPEELDGERGDQYVFVALDADTKLIPHFLVGKRDRRSTERFLREMKDHIQGGHIQFSTDGWYFYKAAIWRNFMQADHAQIIKNYALHEKDEHRYSPPDVQWVKKTKCLGNPDMDRVSTSYVERQNLTMRMSMRRFTRLTNAFSKKLDNLVAACSLYFYYYDFMRIHETIRMTPAMAANVTNHIWGWDAVLP